MKVRRTFPIDTRVIVALLIASVSALWLTPAASAQSVIMAAPTTGNLTVSPGDTIEAGFEVAIAQNSHSTDTVSVTSAVVRVSVNCPNGNSQTISINIPSKSISVPADSGQWSSGGSVYHGQTTAPSTLDRKSVV